MRMSFAAVVGTLIVQVVVVVPELCAVAETKAGTATGHSSHTK
jgi:hypothetical protein